MVNGANTENECVLNAIAAEDTASVLKLTDPLTIRVIDQTRDVLLEYFAREPRPVLDLSDIERCDTAGLQILQSALETAARKGKHVTLRAISEDVQNTAASLGFPQWWEREQSPK